LSPGLSWEIASVLPLASSTWVPAEKLMPHDAGPSLPAPPAASSATDCASPSAAAFWAWAAAASSACFSAAALVAFSTACCSISRCACASARLSAITSFSTSAVSSPIFAASLAASAVSVAPLAAR
jgi:hypothetical protein